MPWKHNGKIIREGKGWVSDDGVKHPGVWTRWTDSEKAEYGLVWEEPPAPQEPYDDMEDRRLAMALWDFQCMKYGDHIGEGAYRVVLPYIEKKLDSLEITREHDDLFDKDRRMKAFIQSYHIAMFLRAMDYLVE